MPERQLWTSRPQRRRLRYTYWYKSTSFVLPRDPYDPLTRTATGSDGRVRSGPWGAARHCGDEASGMGPHAMMTILATAINGVPESRGISWPRCPAERAIVKWRRCLNGAILAPAKGQGPRPSGYVAWRVQVVISPVPLSALPQGHSGAIFRSRGAVGQAGPIGTSVQICGFLCSFV